MVPNKFYHRACINLTCLTKKGGENVPSLKLCKNTQQPTQYSKIEYVSPLLMTAFYSTYIFSSIGIYLQLWIRISCINWTCLTPKGGEIVPSLNSVVIRNDQHSMVNLSMGCLCWQLHFTVCSFFSSIGIYLQLWIRIIGINMICLTPKGGEIVPSLK